MNTHITDDNSTPSRPLGFWLKAADRFMADAFATDFAAEGVTRRDWRLLNRVAGTAPGGASDRPLHPRKLAGLIERGWVAPAADDWELTDEGRAALERLGSVVETMRERVADAVSPEDYATTIATLEQIARTFGWEEGARMPRHGWRGARGHRGHGRRGRGFGGHGFGDRGRGHAFGFRGHGFGGRGFDRGLDDSYAGREFGHGFGHGFARDDEFAAAGFGRRGGYDGHRGHGRGHGPGFGPHSHGRPHAHEAQCAYERGFDAGFTRGRDA